MAKDNEHLEFYEETEETKRAQTFVNFTDCMKAEMGGDFVMKSITARAAKDKKLAQRFNDTMKFCKLKICIIKGNREFGNTDLGDFFGHGDPEILPSYPGAMDAIDGIARKCTGGK